jgi:hypothetical protein
LSHHGGDIAGLDPMHRRAVRGNLPVKAEQGDVHTWQTPPGPDPLQPLQVVKISLPDALEEHRPFLAAIGDDRSVEIF